MNAVKITIEKYYKEIPTDGFPYREFRTNGIYQEYLKNPDAIAGDIAGEFIEYKLKTIIRPSGERFNYLITDEDYDIIYDLCAARIEETYQECELAKKRYYKEYLNKMDSYREKINNLPWYKRLIYIIRGEIGSL